MVKPEVTRRRFLDMQVCVPKDWSFEEAERFANNENPAGTSNGWFARRDGHERLGGDPARAQCQEREGYVHIMLEC